MEIGLGLPIADPDRLLSWARLADQGPFSTLSVLDRIVYDSPDPLVTLAAAAGCTSRINLQTGVLLAPVRQPELLAKQVATLDRLSGGRLVLGVGIGRRADDFAAVAADMAGRGARLEQALTVMRRLWTAAAARGAEPCIGPAPARPGGPPVLIGGFAPAALERAARLADGYHCAASPEDTGRLFEAVRAAWARHGRDGSPRLVAQVNAVLGDDSTVEQAQAAIRAYHSYLGPVADHLAQQAVRTPDALRSALKAFGDVGADEVIVTCWSADLDQFAYVADALA